MSKYTRRDRASLNSAGSGASTRVRHLYPKQLPNLHSPSREAKVRLNALDYAKSHSVATTCRRFGILAVPFLFSLEAPLQPQVPACCGNRFPHSDQANHRRYDARPGRLSSRPPSRGCRKSTHALARTSLP